MHDGMSTENERVIVHAGDGRCCCGADVREDGCGGGVRA